MTTLPAPEKPIRTESPSRVAPPGRSRHWLRRALIAVVVLLLLVVGAGGWYFSGRIESAALASNPAPYLPAYDDVQVVAVTEDEGLNANVLLPKGTVTLKKGPDAAANFEAPGLYALAWDGGTGHVGPPVVNPDGTVTRPLTVLTGSRPEVGDMAAVERSYWLGDPPTGLGLTLRLSGTASMERVKIGANPAWYFTARDAGATPRTIVVVLHGQNGSRLDGLRIVDALAPEDAPADDPTADMPVLVMSYRNDVGAQPDPSGRLQYGQTEWQDLDLAVEWALDRGAQNVVLVGQSMGGAVVAAFLENSGRRSVVSAAVLDAPMLSLEETVRNGARTAMPGGGAVPDPLLWIAQRLTSLRYGVDWAATNYLDDTSWLTVPALVLHGTADPTVPVSVSRTLKQLEPDLVDLQEFPDALHVESWNVDPSRYEQLLRRFIAEHAA